MTSKATFFALALAALFGATHTASAEDTVKLAVGQRGNWDTSVSEIGQRAGIFKKHGLNLEMVYTNGSGETQQAVISGSVDLGSPAASWAHSARIRKARRSVSSAPRRPGRRSLLVREGGFADQDDQGRERPHDRLFDSRLVDQWRRARLHQAVSSWTRRKR